MQCIWVFRSKDGRGSKGKRKIVEREGERIEGREGKAISEARRVGGERERREGQCSWQRRK